MSHNHGFTLIEVLIAMTILIIGIVAAMKMFPISMERARMAGEKELAGGLADDRLGRVRMAGARGLFVNDFNLFDASLTSPSIGRAQTSYSLYDGYSTTVQRLSGAAQVYLQRVNFNVRMPDGRNETFVTYVANQ